MLRNVLCRTTPVSRAQGHSAIGGAAYRAGENIRARGQGENGADKWFRYSGRRDVVRETFIMTHDGAPDYATDRAELWNRIEEMETRKNARLGRELQLGFAYELSHDDQRALLKAFVQREAIDRGFVADVAIHDYGRTRRPLNLGGTDADITEIRAWAAELPFLERDEARETGEAHVRIRRDRQGDVTGYQLYQPHAHVRVTPRIAAGGEWETGKAASRELNKHETTMNWRYDWAKLQNAYLERAGSPVRVTCTPEDEGGFPIYRRSEGQNGPAHAIEARAERLSHDQRRRHEDAAAKLEADREFTQAHNAALEMGAQARREEEQAGEAQHATRQYRIAGWHRNLGQWLEQWREWREAIPERAAAWRERLASLRPQLNAWFGYEPPAAGATGETGRDAAMQERPPPEQER